MNKKTDVRDGFILFDVTVDFGDGVIIYGILFNQESEKRNEENCKSISEYVEYIAGMGQIIKYGVPLKDNSGWSFPQRKITVNCDVYSLATLIGIFFKDKVGYKTYTFDVPIVWKTDEVDEDNNDVIVNRSLIDRYADTKIIK